MARRWPSGWRGAPPPRRYCCWQSKGGPSARWSARGTLERLGRSIRVVTVQPIQGTLDAVKWRRRPTTVRVLTHEILNSLTPVTSLAATAADLLDDPDLAANPRIGDARAAVSTLARRAHGLGHFIEAYRAVAHTPEIQRRSLPPSPGRKNWVASSRRANRSCRWRSKWHRRGWRSTPTPICSHRC